VKVLIVEDDINKLESLKEYSSSVGLEHEAASSFKSAQKKILECEYDLIFLDMTIPTFDQDYKTKGGKWRSFGGEELLVEMQRKNISSKAIVITGYDKVGTGTSMMTLNKLRKKLKDNFQGLFVGIVYFDPFNSDWKESLDRIIAREFKK